jgi:hypothetical protein
MSETCKDVMTVGTLTCFIDQDGDLGFRFEPSVAYQRQTSRDQQKMLEHSADLLHLIAKDVGGNA